MRFAVWLALAVACILCLCREHTVVATRQDPSHSLEQDDLDAAIEEALTHQSAGDDSDAFAPVLIEADDAVTPSFNNPRFRERQQTAARWIRRRRRRWLRRRRRRIWKAARKFVTKVSKKSAHHFKKAYHRVRKHVTKVYNKIKNGINTALEYAKQIAKLIKCRKKIFGHGGWRVCLPKCVADLKHKALGKHMNVKGMKKAIHICRQGERPCLPSFIHLPFPSGVKKIMNTVGMKFRRCPLNCPTGRFQRPALCWPKYMNGIKLGNARKHLDPCPSCVKLCLPAGVKSQIKSVPWKIVRIPECPGAGCAVPKQHVCVPSEFRFVAHLRAVRPYLHICGKCEALCLPKSIFNVPALPYNSTKYLKHCPEHQHCRSRKYKKPALCIPKQFEAMMKRVPGLKDIQVACPECVQPCLPDWGRKMITRVSRQHAKVDIMPYLSLKKCKTKHCNGLFKNRLCKPDYLRHIPALNNLPFKLNKCGSCDKLCIPRIIKLTGKASKFLGESLPFCTKKCRTPRRPALCVPPSVKDLNIKGLNSLHKCKKCQDFCSPPFALPILHKLMDRHMGKKMAASIRKHISIPACPTAQCRGATKPKMCIPDWMDAYRNNSVVKDIGLPNCRACEKFCVPHFIQIPNIGGKFALEKHIPRCPRCLKKHRKPTSLCLPRGIKELKVFTKLPAGLRNITKHIPTCPHCVESCIPHPFQKLLSVLTASNTKAKQISQYINIPKCTRAKCKSRTLKLCVPRYLKHFKVLDTLKAGGVAECGPCEELCIPSYIDTSAFPMINLAYKPCPSTCGKGKSPSHSVCLPAELSGLRKVVPQTSQLITCPKCVTPCLPEALREVLKLPAFAKKFVKLPTCRAPACPQGRYNHALCLPHFLRHVNITDTKLKSVLTVCPTCTKSCLPKLLSGMSLPKGFDVPSCPDTHSECKKVKKVLCLPKEFRLLNIKEFKTFNLASCGDCEEACLPSFFKVKLPMGMKLPECPSDVPPTSSQSSNTTLTSGSAKNATTNATTNANSTTSTSGNQAGASPGVTPITQPSTVEGSISLPGAQGPKSAQKQTKGPGSSGDGRHLEDYPVGVEYYPKGVNANA